MNFHIDLVADPKNYMSTIQEAINDCNQFMRRSKIALPFKSELTEEVRIKEMDLLSATTELHGKLTNLHMGYSSLELIENRSEEQSEKLKNIRIEASETFGILKSIGRSMIEALNEHFNLFFVSRSSYLLAQNAMFANTVNIDFKYFSCYILNSKILSIYHFCLYDVSANRSANRLNHSM